MKLSIISLVISLGFASSHTVFTTLFINDVDQGDGTCVRMPVTPDNATDPVNILTSGDMACGFGGTQGVARVCPVAQGATLCFQFREWADASSPGAIDASHKGPCTVYMKSVASAIEDTAVGGGWFKIAEEGYDNTTSQWCTEKLIQNNGTFDVVVPNDLAGGYYLVRTELLALQQAGKIPPNPQFYVGCAQIFLKSNATATPSNTVLIPGYTNISDPSVLFNIYTPTWPYNPPGPTLYVSNTSPSTQVMALAVQGEGLLPQNVVAINANWWGIELDSYSTSAGCWNASTNCFDQTTACYNSAPPTGALGCHIWESKCDAIQAACSTTNFNGPPGKGTILTPNVVPYSAVIGLSPSEAAVTMTGLPSGYSPSLNSSLTTMSSTFSPSRVVTTSNSTSLLKTTVTSIISNSATITSTTAAFDSLPAKIYSTSVLTTSNTSTTSSSYNNSILINSPTSFSLKIASSTLASVILSTYTSWVTNNATITASSTTTVMIPVVITPSTNHPTPLLDITTPTSDSPTAATIFLPDSSDLPPSTDGKCGQGSGVTCLGSTFGFCCSVNGFCGNDGVHCGFMNCQIGQGSCGVITTSASQLAQRTVARLPRGMKYRSYTG